MTLTKLIRTFFLAAALAIAPAAAYAVNVSANDGNGTQYRTASHGNGADVSGSLRATSSSKTVYYSGKVAIGNGCSDVNTGRCSDNTNSTSYVTRGGRITAVFTPICGFQGVKSRVCTVRGFGLPDLCGSDSSTY